MSISFRISLFSSENESPVSALRPLDARPASGILSLKRSVSSAAFVCFKKQSVAVILG